MTVLYIDPGGDHTQDLSIFTSNSGSVSCSSAAAHTGPRGYLLDLQSTGPHRLVYPSIFGSTPGRFQFWFRRTTDTSGASDASNRNLLTQEPGQLIMNRQTGVVSLNNATSGSGFSPTLNQWYRFTLLRKPNGGNWDCAWLVDGSTQQERINFSVSPVSNGQFGHSAAVDGYGVWNIDDLYVDDDQSYTDPGDIRVTAKLPAGTTGTTNAWGTLGSGTNRWDYVSERPISITNGFTKTGSGGGRVNETFNVQAAGDGDADISGLTILARGAWIYAVRAIAPPGSAAGIILDGTVSDVTLGTSEGYHTVYDTSASYPGANAIGMRSADWDGMSPTRIEWYEGGILLAYLPGETPDPGTPFSRRAGLLSGGGFAAGLRSGGRL